MAQKSLAEIKQILRQQKPYLAEKYGVTELGVFGSYLRGEQRPDSVSSPTGSKSWPMTPTPDPARKPAF